MQVMEQSGVRLGRKRVDFIPADCHIRPLRDQIIVKPLPWEPSPTLKKLGIEIVWKGGVLRGEVLAVGPGIYHNIHRKGKKDGKDFHTVHESRYLTPTDVKVGDIVELGGLEVHGYDHWLTIQWGDQLCIVASERDVTGVVIGSPK